MGCGRFASTSRAAKLQCRQPVLLARPSARAVVAPAISASNIFEEASSDRTSEFDTRMRIPATCMASSSGGALMSKSKLSFQQQQKSWSPKLEDAGGGGGIGKIVVNGGGGGGDDDDDDDYFREGGDGDDGDDTRWWHKVPLSQLYDQVTVRAVLSEWCMTVEKLPGFLRMVASMQYYSSAQWVRYLTIQERPNVFRTVERALSRFPDARSGFVGRMLADPAFMQKTALEGGIAFAAAAAHEVHVRGARIKDEMDFAFISAMSVALSAAACAALVAPSKTPSPPGGVFPWQRMLNKLPNNAFEKNTPARSFEVPHRVSAFFTKGLEISAVYGIIGAVSAALQHCILAARRAGDPKAEGPVTPLPSISRAGLGLGLFGGFAANTRMQAAAGLDRTLLEYAKANTALQVIGLSALFRGLTQLVLENPAGLGPDAVVACSRPALGGAPVRHVPSPIKPVRKIRKKLVKRRRATLQEGGATQTSSDAVVDSLSSGHVASLA